jgi:hypothetical protein
MADVPLREFFDGPVFTGAAFRLEKKGTSQHRDQGEHNARDSLVTHRARIRGQMNCETESNCDNSAPTRGTSRV